MSLAQQKKLKALALHGYLQTAKAFKDKTGSFRRLAKKVDFHYLDGPFVVTPPQWWLQQKNGGDADSPHSASPSSASPSTDLATSECRAFYLPVDGERPVLCTKYDKVFEGLEYVLTCIGQNACDGILAFSQSSVIAELIAAVLSPAAKQPENKNLYKLRQELDDKGLLQKARSIRFFIFSGAFPPTDTHLVQVMSELNGKIDFPSLHIIGEQDMIVGKERGEAVAGLFKDSISIMHPGGHMLCATASLVKVPLNAFLDKFETS